MRLSVVAIGMWWGLLLMAGEAGAEQARLRSYSIEDLVYFAERGNLSRVKEFVNAGVDINAFDPRTLKNALAGAVLRKHREVIDYLLENGADPNALNEAGIGCTHFAAKVMKIDILDKLFEYGADIGEMKFNSYYTLCCATKARCEDENREQNIRKVLGMGARQVLLSKYFPNYVGKKNRQKTPLMWASICASLEEVKLLYANGGNLEVQDIKGETALHHSVMSKNPQVMEFLLKVGADVNAKNDSGYTVLMDAAWMGKLDMVKTLLRHGASINEPDRHGVTALGHVVIKCNPKEDAIKVMKYLIESGADFDFQDKNGRTPLIIAARFRSSFVEVPKLLLDAGADIHAKDNQGKTALDHAIESGNLGIAKLLRREIRKRNKPNKAQ